MSFAIEELHDVIKIIALSNLSKGHRIHKSTLKRRIDKVCVSLACIDMSELEKTLKAMASEGLVIDYDDTVQLTEQGLKLGKEWESLLLKKEPILEVVAGLVGGVVTCFVVILATFVAALEIRTV